MDSKESLILALVLILALFFRFLNLGSAPPGLYPDEAINGNQAITSPGKIFYPENNGREGLFINLLALSARIFGPSILSLRLVPALFGTLTVLGVYLLGKELFTPFVGLASSFFLAFSFWHINFSRIVFRAILVPFFLTYTFYFLFKGLKKRKTGHLVLAGLLYGLGFHTYIAYRFSVLILPLVVLLWWRKYKRKNRQKRFLVLTAIFVLSILATALPIGIYFLKNPQHFFGRGGVSIFNQPNPLKAGLKSTIIHLSSFNIIGDYNWRHNIAGQPTLFWPVGILFLTGLIWAFKEALSQPEKNRERTANYILLILWWGALLLPGILTYEGMPHHLRIIGTIPPTFIFSALGASVIKNKTKKTPLRIVFLLSGLLFALFLPCMTFSRYFLTWSRSVEVRGAFSSDYVAVGELINQTPEHIQVFVVVNQSGVPVHGLPMPAQTPMFVERTENRDLRAEYLLPQEAENIRVSGTTMIIPLQTDKTLLSRLKMIFPGSAIESEIVRGVGIPYLLINKQDYVQ